MSPTTFVVSFSDLLAIMCPDYVKASAHERDTFILYDAGKK